MLSAVLPWFNNPGRMILLLQISCWRVWEGWLSPVLSSGPLLSSSAISISPFVQWVSCRARLCSGSFPSDSNTSGLGWACGRGWGRCWDPHPGRMDFIPLKSSLISSCLATQLPCRTWCPAGQKYSLVRWKYLDLLGAKQICQGSVLASDICLLEAEICASV